jgi:hypothetical protein
MTLGAAASFAALADNPLQLGAVVRIFWLRSAAFTFSLVPGWALARPPAENGHPIADAEYRARRAARGFDRTDVVRAADISHDLFKGAPSSSRVQQPIEKVAFSRDRFRRSS